MTSPENKAEVAKVYDPVKWKTFHDNYLSTDDQIFSLMSYLKNACGWVYLDTQANQEKAWLKCFRDFDAGISVYQSDTNFTNWKRRVASSGAIIRVTSKDCGQ
ncbi:hypothetical protein [Deminuibacter soli]|nr:hypothetical protein [Deminuibacter soli]